ncbi:MAG: Tryptophanyl-tRNA synthetase, partial [uncultured Ramlibacter sp.]
DRDRPLPHRHHHHGNAPPGQLRRRHPAGRAGQPSPRHRELLLPGRLPRADQVRRAVAHPAFDAGDRRLLAGGRPRPGAGLLLPAVRHPGDSGADLAAHLRHGQGAAQSRPRLQGLGGQEPRRRRRSRHGRDRRPVHVPGADGGGHHPVQRPQDPGGPRPGAAHRDGAQHGGQLQPPLRRTLHPAGGGGRRIGGHLARARRPQDEQELRQRDRVVWAARAGAQADLLHRHRLAFARRAQGGRGFGAVPGLPGLRDRSRDRGAAQGLRRRHRLGRCQAAAVRAHRPRGRPDARALRATGERPGAAREDPARRRRQGAVARHAVHGEAAACGGPAQPRHRCAARGPRQGRQGIAAFVQAVPRDRRQALLQAGRWRRRPAAAERSLRVAAGSRPRRGAAEAGRLRRGPGRGAQARRRHRTSGAGCPGAALRCL